MKDLEAIRPSSILDIIYSGEAIAGMVKVDVKRPVQGKIYTFFALTSVAEGCHNQANAQGAALCQVKSFVKHVPC